MQYLMIRYKLKNGVKHSEFENWVRTSDYPQMRGLSRVSSFNTYRTDALLMGEGVPSQDYFEIFAINDLTGFTSEDMPGDIVQSVMGEFMNWVDNPEFTIANLVE
ncbi:REDY-like protein HapK [Sphingorhabdus lutea]|uniref:REDY-like protein HapK n=1 Tax=Sphingorhabdus lutea TaxID=1913578 RepID=A0A1L3JD86_9SPHN|nr:REDY-like protein HapK [Sphingorhabdus lutea]APG63088.1 REDY-like protein HapK [Sphingorhabdus lutea]